MSRSDSVQSVVRGLDLLDLVSQAERGLSLAELSERSGLKPSTVHNLARSLISRRFLQKLSHPIRYTLGPAVSELAQRQRDRFWRRQAVEAVRRIAGRLPEATVSMAEMSGGEVCVSLRMSPARPGVIEHPRHQALSPYSSASAILFDAYGTDPQRASYRQRFPFAEYGLGFWKSEEHLTAFLIEVRKQGYSAPPVGSERLLRVAVPVFDPHSGELTVSLGAAQLLSGQADELSLRGEMVEALLLASGSLCAGSPSL